VDSNNNTVEDWDYQAGIYSDEIDVSTAVDYIGISCEEYESDGSGGNNSAGGGYGINITGTADPVPCVASSGASVDCSGQDDNDPLLQIAQQVSSNLQNSDQLMTLLGAGALAPAALVEGLGAVLTAEGAASLSSALQAAVPAIGNLPDLSGILNNATYNVLSNTLGSAGWSMAANQSWVNGIIQAGQSVALQSVLNSANTFNGGAYNQGYTVYGVELGWFFNAGYTVVGSYLAPPVP